MIIYKTLRQTILGERWNEEEIRKKISFHNIDKNSANNTHDREGSWFIDMTLEVNLKS